MEEKLNKYYKDLIKQYGKNRILGLFTIGNINYNLQENENDYKILCIYLPTFEELCLNSDILCENIDEHLYIKDIRYFFNSVEDTNSYALETLFSKYSFIAARYKNLFNKYLYENREYISRYNPAERVERCINRVNQLLQVNSNDNLAEIYRLYISASKYADYKPSSECYYIDSPVVIDFIKRIRKGEILIDIESIQEDFQKIYDRVKGSAINLEAIKLVKKGILEIMNLAINTDIDIDTFKKSLTEKEKEAFEIIEKELVDGEGYIKVTQLTYATNISRPVFTNLFQKITQSNIGEITPAGVKGTKIFLYEI